jgi:hypothetical protein
MSLRNLSPAMLVAIGGIIEWLYSAIVSGMPDLPPNASWSERWAYNVMHTIAANLDKLKLPINGKTS